MVAGSDLRTRPGKRGRARLEWYDSFTNVLLNIGEKAGIETTLYKDRINAEPRGWLLQIARVLETFFDPDMRSPSAEACWKRLERSRRRLVGRQNSMTRRRNLSM
jgi:hypothetical protein